MKLNTEPYGYSEQKVSYSEQYSELKVNTMLAYAKEHTEKSK